MTITEKIIKEIEKSRKVIIFGHKDWDGDSLGSALALQTAIKSLDKEALVISDEQMPQSLFFLSKHFEIELVGEILDADLAIVLDAADISRTSSPRNLKNFLKTMGRLILIDHHTPGNLMEKSVVAWVNPNSSSVSEMVYSLIKEMGVKIEKSMATGLLTGIVTDTSAFQSQNTSPGSLSISSDLILGGARMQEVVKNAHESQATIKKLKLMGVMISRIFFSENRKCLIAYITSDEVKKYHVEPAEIARIANRMNSVEGVKLAILLVEMGEGDLKVSLRTSEDFIDLAKLAKAYGGGGHQKAAGFTIKGKIEAKDDKICIV